MEYFTRLSVPLATPAANAEDVIRCIDYVFSIHPLPSAIYCDLGQHFDNQKVKSYLAERGITLTFGPSGSSKSMGFIERGNRLLEDVLRKTGMEWDRVLGQSAFNINTRIVQHLRCSPQEIAYGIPPTPLQSLSLTAITDPDVRNWAAFLKDPTSHHLTVHAHLQHTAATRDIIALRDAEEKKKMAARYNRGVAHRQLDPGDLVMVYQADKPKLEPRYRGPFIITGPGGTHGKSFRIMTLDGRRIRHFFHGDHLRLFIPRTGYLAEGPGIGGIYPTVTTLRRRKHEREQNWHMGVAADQEEV